MLSTYGSRGDVEPLAGLGLALQALGAEVVVSAPGDLSAVLGTALAPETRARAAAVAGAMRADVAMTAAKLLLAAVSGSQLPTPLEPT